MTVPKFNETFLPILKVLADGRTVKSSELAQLILEAKYFTLSPDELTLKTASGSNLFIDRVAWGKAYLKQGKFLVQPSWGLVQISEKGKKLIESGVQEFSLSELKKDRDFTAHESQITRKAPADKLLGSYSPQDLVDAGIKELSVTLKQELLDKLHNTDPYYFQEVILVLFQKMGYGDFESTPKSGDGGIDGIINQDQLGISRIYIQAKRYKEGNKVREPEVRNFIGAMSGDVRTGIFVTTSTFDDLAIEKARNDRNHTIILIDGDKLADLMIKYNVGVQVKSQYEVKVLDEDFFELG